MTKNGHNTVSINNKMFVISRADTNDSEVFDSITNKFTYIKSNPHAKDVCYFTPKTSAFSVGYKIHGFKNAHLKEKYTILTSCYDVKKEAWISEDNYSPECFKNFRCAKMFKH